MEIFFYLLMTIGYIQPMETHEGRETYRYTHTDGKVWEHAYKAEIIEALESGSFEYNDFLNEY